MNFNYEVINEMTIQLIRIIITVYLLLLFFKKNRYNVSLITMFFNQKKIMLIIFGVVILSVIVTNILNFQIPMEWLGAFLGLKIIFMIAVFIDTIITAIIIIKYVIDMNNEEKALNNYLKFVKKNP